MSEAERLLKELWAEDEPPMRDAAFTVAVLETAARRRLRRGIVVLAAGATAAGATAWALAPLAAHWLSTLQAGSALGPAAAAAFLAWAVWSAVSDPPREAV